MQTKVGENEESKEENLKEQPLIETVIAAIRTTAKIALSFFTEPLLSKILKSI